MAEVFTALTDGIWSDVGNNSSTIRRNLQRDHLRRLSTLVLGSRGNAYSDAYSYAVFVGSSNVPADAKSLARMHLTQMNDRIGQALGRRLDDTTRAHLIECRQRITKTLDPTYTANDL